MSWPLSWPWHHICPFSKNEHSSEPSRYELLIAVFCVFLRPFVFELARGTRVIFTPLPPPSAARSAGDPSAARVNMINSELKMVDSGEEVIRYLSPLGNGNQNCMISQLWSRSLRPPSGCDCKYVSTSTDDDMSPTDRSIFLCLVLYFST